MVERQGKKHRLMSGPIGRAVISTSPAAERLHLENIAKKKYFQTGCDDLRLYLEARCTNFNNVRNLYGQPWTGKKK